MKQFLLLLSLVLGAALCVVQQPVKVKAQWVPPGFPPGTFNSRAALDARTYVGLGDLSLGTFWGHWSADRCYAKAYSGTVVDVVDAATGNTTGTRRQCNNGVISDLVSGSACTFVTGNACSSIATTCAVACNVVTFYEQTGNTNCHTTVACSPTQATNANRAAFVLNAFNGHACALFTGSSSQSYTKPIIDTGQTQPMSFIGELERTGAFTSLGTPMQPDQPSIGFANSANTVDIYAGTAQSYTVSDSALHSLVGIFNGASSNLITDGVAGTVSNAGADTIRSSGFGDMIIGADNAPHYFTGYFCEMAVVAGDQTSNAAAINSNQAGYW